MKNTPKNISQLSPCSFCSSQRVRFYTCSDDRGEYVAARCDRCGAQGPEIRGPIGDDSAITDEMRAEAAEAWGHRAPGPLAPLDHQVHVITPATNGHNHNGHGSVA